MEDVIITVQVEPEHIDLLNRLLEGAGHIGVMSTLDRQRGVVSIRATDGTAGEVWSILDHLPFACHRWQE